MKTLLLTEIDYVHGEITEVEVLYKLDNLNHLNINVEEQSKVLIVPLAPINWRLLAGIIAACIIISVVVWQVTRHSGRRLP